MTKVIGGRIPPKEHAKLKIEDAIDRVLERLIFSKLDERPREVRRDCMFTPHEMGPMWCWPGVEQDVMFFPPEDVNAPDLVWPLRTGFVMERPDRSLLCHYMQSVPAKRLRGRYRLCGRYNVEDYVARVEPDGSVLSAVNAATWLGRKWVYAGLLRYDQSVVSAVRESGAAPMRNYSQREDCEPDEPSIGEMVAMGQSVALTYRYIWGAQFSIDQSARLIIPCQPEGIFELFNDRDKPADRDRRAPLRHWVRQHVRRRNAAHDFARVRAHLRGAERFSWRGYDVVIRPSAFDEEKNRGDVSGRVSGHDND